MNAKEALPEARQVHHVQGGDVVRPACQVVLPEALLPEAEPVHGPVVVAEGGVGQGPALQA